MILFCCLGYLEEYVNLSLITVMRTVSFFVINVVVVAIIITTMFAEKSESLS